MQRSAKVGWLHPEVEIWASLLPQKPRAMMASGLNHRSPSHYPYIPPCTPLPHLLPAISFVLHFLLLLSTVSRQLTYSTMSLLHFWSLGPLKTSLPPPTPRQL